MKHDLFSGRTLDDVLAQASRHLRAPVHALGYEILKKPSGFFGKWFSSSLRVRVWVLDEDSLKEAARSAVRKALHNEYNPLKAEAAPPKPLQGNGYTPPKEGAPPAEDSAPTLSNPPQGLLTFFQAFERAFDISPNSIQVQAEPGGLTVEMNTPALMDLLGQSEKLPPAIEHIAQRLCQRFQCPFKIHFDFGKIYQSQEHKLEQLARTTAASVLESGAPVALSLGSSYERRLVHKTVAAIAGVESRSTGVGSNRRLIIFPKGSPPSPASSSLIQKES